MPSADKGSAISRIASDLTSSEARTPAISENPAPDLFAALDDDADAYAGQTIKPIQRRGRGRPAGSEDVSTRDMRRWLASRGYRDPLEFLAATFSADPRQLAADLAGHGDPARAKTDDVFEAVKIQKNAAEAALPYLHRKMPLDVHHTGEAARPLIVIMDGPASGAGVGTSGAMSAFEDVEFQQVSDGSGNASDGQSHGDASHDANSRDKSKA